jgi:DNA-binding IclR family transcriptional regulator
MTKQQYNIASVEKAFQIMDIMAEKNGELSVTQIATMVDASVSSVNRMLMTLVNTGYVVKNRQTGRYLISNKIFITTNKLLRQNSFVQSFVPLAHKVSEEYGVTVCFNTVHGKNAVHLFRVAQKYNRDTDFKIGDVIPAYCSSAGRAILSMYSGEELDAYFEDLVLIKYQENTRGSEEALRRELREAAEKGYAVTSEEYTSGVFSFSFPLRDRTGRRYAFTLITMVRNRNVVYNDKVIAYLQRKLREIQQSAL